MNTEIEKKSLTRAEKKKLMNQMIISKITPSEIAKALDLSREHVSREKSKLLKNPFLEKKRLKKFTENLDYFTLDNYHKDDKMKASDLRDMTKDFFEHVFPKTTISKSENMNVDISIDCSDYRNVNALTNNTTREAIEAVEIPQKIVVENEGNDEEGKS